MNRLLLIIFLISTSHFLEAQDTIVKRNGEKISAKVLEINTTNIRYKNPANPDGPLYMLEKEQINYVVYLNGMKDNFSTYVPPIINGDRTVADLTIQTAGKYYYYKSFKITEPDMHAVIKRQNDPKLNLMITHIENKKFLQDVGFLVSVPVFISGFYIYQKNRPTRGRRGAAPVYNSVQQRGQRNGIALMLGALACDVVSVSFMLDRKRHNHMVVNAYNKKITLADK